MYDDDLSLGCVVTFGFNAHLQLYYQGGLASVKCVCNSGLTPVGNLRMAKVYRTVLISRVQFIVGVLSIYRVQFNEYSNKLR